MARYSFTGRSYNFGSGGGGTYGIGNALLNSLGTGIDLANGFRDLENRNITDAFRVPAQAAGYDASRLQFANAALSQAALAPYLTELAQQPPIPMANMPNYDPSYMQNMTPPWYNQEMMYGNGQVPLNTYFLPQ